MPDHTVAIIKGEDAAPEAVDAALAVLEALGTPLNFVFPLVGEPAIAQTSNSFPPEAREVIDAADTTLFGATSGPSGIALFYLRFGKQTFANVRPARYLQGATSPLAAPESVDFVVVRENLEGLYCGLEGSLSDLKPLALNHALGGGVHERAGAWSLKVVTEEGSRRIARFAADLARRRSAEGHPGRVTIGAKHNILRSDALFVHCCSEVLDGLGIEFEVNHIDNLARRMVAEAPDLDVVLVPNLYGDILSDLAAGVIGGLGMMPSGCYGDTYAYFEPPHGTAPDLTGLGRINPTAQILTSAMMLEYLGLAGHARQLVGAIEAVCRDGAHLTVDQGGSAGTGEFTDAVIAAL